MSKALWKGNEAVAESLLRAGLDFFAGYPITPSTEILEYLSMRMPRLFSLLPVHRQTLFPSVL